LHLAEQPGRRTSLLLAGHDGLPTLLLSDTGINAGFLIPQCTVADGDEDYEAGANIDNCARLLREERLVDAVQKELGELA